MAKRISHDEFLKRFNTKISSQYFDIIWEYNWSINQIKVKCKTCWKEYYFYKAKELLWQPRRWCPECSKKNTRKLCIKSIQHINKRINKYWFKIVDHIDEKHISTVECIICWRKYNRYINNIKSWYWCKLCNWASKWEKIMATILDKLWINYIYEWTLRCNNRLRYDFIINDYNLIIEIDWEFHRKDVAFFWKKINRNRINNDVIKNANAIAEWYSIIRIKYQHDKLWDFFSDIHNKLILFLPLEKASFTIKDLFIL